VRVEPETEALEAAFQPFDLAMASELAFVEVLRAGRHELGPPGLDVARHALADFTLLSYTTEVRERAIALDPATLSALDAIRLASALSIQPRVDALLCYDRRLCDAAAAAGLRVLSPGVPTAPAG
jgi:hypothetical protein